MVCWESLERLERSARLEVLRFHKAFGVIKTCEAPFTSFTVCGGLRQFVQLSQKRVMFAISRQVHQQGGDEFWAVLG